VCVCVWRSVPSVDTEPGAVLSRSDRTKQDMQLSLKNQPKSQDGSLD
jgi:hypothetical protein